MGQDNVDIGNTVRQINAALESASKWLRKGYYSQDGKGKIDENALREGHKHMSTAESLINQNLEPLVKQINPSVLMQNMIAAGVTYEVAAHATNAIKAFQAAGGNAAINAAARVAASAAGRAGSSVAIAKAGMLICGAVAAIALAFLVWKFYEWLTTPKADIAPIARQYEERYVKPTKGRKPFEMPMRPGNL